MAAKGHIKKSGDTRPCACPRAACRPRTVVRYRDERDRGPRARAPGNDRPAPDARSIIVRPHLGADASGLHIAAARSAGSWIATCDLPASANTVPPLFISLMIWRSMTWSRNSLSLAWIAAG